MVARHQAQVQTIAKAKRISEEEAQQVLLASQRKKPKKGQLVNVLQKCVYSEYSYAMVNCESHLKDKHKDFTLFLVYDHR